MRRGCYPSPDAPKPSQTQSIAVLSPPNRTVSVPMPVARSRGLIPMHFFDRSISLLIRMCVGERIASPRVRRFLLQCKRQQIPFLPSSNLTDQHTCEHTHRGQQRGGGADPTEVGGGLASRAGTTRRTFRTRRLLHRRRRQAALLGQRGGTFTTLWSASTRRRQRLCQEQHQDKRGEGCGWRCWSDSSVGVGPLDRIITSRVESRNS